MDYQKFVDKSKNKVGPIPTYANMCYNPEGWVIYNLTIKRYVELDY